MSNIKQERHFSSTSQFPVTGSENVEYTARDLTYGLDWYWHAASGTYKRKIGNILAFPYSNNEHPTLNTIQKALDYLLSDQLAVTFTVFPTSVKTLGEQQIQFNWATTKAPENLDSVVISATGYESPNLVDTMTTMQGTLTKNDYNITGITDFLITVTDTDGNIAQATAQVNVVGSGVDVTLDVSPTTYSPGSGSQTFTLSWEVDQYKESLEELIITNTATYQSIDAKAVSTNLGSGVGCSGTTTVNMTLSDDVTFTIFAKVSDSVTGQDIATVSYLDGTVVFTVTGNGSPLNGAEIVIPGVGTYNTNTSGIATISNVPYGDHTATITKEGYVQEDYEFTVDEPNEAFSVDLSFVFYQVTFTVSDNYPGDAHPIEGATVTINGDSESTDEFGQAIFTLSPGSYDYDVSAAGFAEISDAQFTLGAENTEVPVTLTVTGLVSNLQVTNPTPGEDATITYTFIPEPYAGGDDYEGESVIEMFIDGISLGALTRGTDFVGNTATWTVPEGATGDLTVNVTGVLFNGNETNTITWGPHDLGSNPVYIGVIQDSAFDGYTKSDIDTSVILSDFLTSAVIGGSQVLPPELYVSETEPIIDLNTTFGAGTTQIYPWVAFPQSDPNFVDFDRVRSQSIAVWNKFTGIGVDGETWVNPPWWIIDTTVNGVDYKVYFNRGLQPSTPYDDTGISNFPFSDASGNYVFKQQ